MSTQSQIAAEATEEIETGEAHRRCWRCQQWFACAPSDVIAARPEWWLCGPCRGVLIAPASEAVR